MSNELSHIQLEQLNLPFPGCFNIPVILIHIYTATLLISCKISHYCSAGFVVLLSTPYVNFQLSRRYYVRVLNTSVVACIAT